MSVAAAAPGPQGPGPLLCMAMAVTRRLRLGGGRPGGREGWVVAVGGPGVARRGRGGGGDLGW